MGLHWDCAAACVCEVQIEAVSLCERRDWKEVFVKWFSLNVIRVMMWSEFLRTVTPIRPPFSYSNVRMSGYDASFSIFAESVTAQSF